MSEARYCKSLIRELGILGLADDGKDYAKCHPSVRLGAHPNFEAGVNIAEDVVGGYSLRISRQSTVGPRVVFGRNVIVEDHACVAKEVVLPPYTHVKAYACVHNRPNSPTGFEIQHSKRGFRCYMKNGDCDYRER